jgi:hypothetical protein
VTEALPQQPQNLTLSLRISEALRNRLEDLRKLTASRKGDNVSTSEIAKRLLEAAHHERMEVVELLGKATESLLEIRRKGEAGQMLSRAQWTLLAYYVQRGSEGFSKTPPSRESFIGMLKAFSAAYQLSNKRSRYDGEYFSNLGPDAWPEQPLGSSPITPEVVRVAVAKLLQHLEDPASRCGPPIMAGRNLYLLLEDAEKPCSVAELNQALAPFFRVLWRVAARGHYAAAREPIRASGQTFFRPPIPTLHENGFTLTFSLGMDGELSMLLCLPGTRGPAYPLAPYPMIAEFRSMLRAFPEPRPQQIWDGERLFAFTTQAHTPGEPIDCWFRAKNNGITVGFSSEEWKTVGELFRRGWEMPEVKVAWEALSLEYGEM